MKSIILLFLFCGMFMIVHGIYEQKINEIEKNPRIEYKFVPRTYYDEQLSMESSFGEKYDRMFQTASPWFDNNVGAGLDVLKTDVRTNNSKR